MVTLVNTLDPNHKSQAASAEQEKVRPRHPEKAHRPDNPVLRKPKWIRVKAPTSPVYKETHELVRKNNLVTVCEEAGCPNIGECWSKKHASFMILGDTCTRACAFCNVRTVCRVPLTRVSLQALPSGCRHGTATCGDYLC